MHPIESLKPPSTNILGVAVSAIDMQDAMELSESFLRQHRRGYICVTGVHGVMEAQRDPALRRILNQALLCTPDGMPMVWLGHLDGHRSMRRVYGPDFMLEMCRRGARRGYRHFLYGGKPGVARLLKARLEVLVPAIDIVGTYAPPFGALSLDQERAFLDAIARTKPDIIWVGLSTPKQERFMATYADKVGSGLLVGVGAAFDIHAGLMRDAPQWMKTCGLQWLDRLSKEPRRLWRRYLKNNPQFLWNVALQLCRLRHYEIS